MIGEQALGIGEQALGNDGQALGNDGQALGDSVESVLVAPAITSTLGESQSDAAHTHESTCLNCGTPLIGSHCHQCGQGAHVHRTLGAFFHDLLHGVFHFEGKIWHTLPLLAWRPGDLTRRYIDGQRARFVSPLALFLFSVFLLFAAYHQTASEPVFNPPVAVAGAATGSDQNQKYSDVATFDHAVKAFRANPGLVAYKAQSYAYKYSWALIPISVPFLWLLFPFSRRFHIYDHTVFVTYSLSFMTLLGALAMVLGALGASTMAGLLMLAPPLHMYRQLRGTYGCSRLGGVLRAVALSIFAFVALLLFTILIAAQTGA